MGMAVGWGGRDGVVELGWWVGVIGWGVRLG